MQWKQTQIFWKDFTIKNLGWTSGFHAKDNLPCAYWDKTNALYNAYMSRDMTKPTKWHVRPVKTQISLVIRPVWSESSLPAWRNFGSLATHWAHSEDSDETGCTVTLLVLSCRGSISTSVSLSSMRFRSETFYSSELSPCTAMEDCIIWMSFYVFCPLL